MRKFELRPNGDPFSTAWKALEYEHSFADDGAWYRGDLPHYGKRALIRLLRRLYPKQALILIRSNYR